MEQGWNGFFVSEFDSLQFRTVKCKCEFDGLKIALEMRHNNVKNKN